MIRGITLCCLFIVWCKMGLAIEVLPAYNIFYTTKDKALQPYLELYWQVDANTLNFHKDSTGIWLDKIKTELTIGCDTGIITTQKYYLKTTPANSLRAAQLQNIVDLHRISLPEGKVYYNLILTDANNEVSIYEHSDTINVPEAYEKTHYSRIQLLDTAYESDQKNNIFYRAGQLQIPLCLNFLDDNRKHIHAYTELYNAHKINDSLLPLTEDIYISKKEYGSVEHELHNTDTLNTIQEIIPIQHSMKIDMLPSGNYYLNYVLKDKKGKDVTKQSLFFQLINMNPVVKKDTSTQPAWEKVNVLELSETFVHKYTTAQLKAILKMLLPISSKSEHANIEIFLSEPDDTYMRYFIYNFWKARSTGDAEKGWEKYTKKVKEVNRLFGSSITAGYETDRGFYQLKYGEPDQRVIVTNEQGAFPYEIWVYNAPGTQSTQGVFLFYSPEFMINDYKLLHSTVIGETRNTAWRSLLYKTGQASDNLNSRAEQIIRNK